MRTPAADTPVDRRNKVRPAPGQPGSGASVRLSGPASPVGTVRVLALSWRADLGRYLTPAEFRATLAAAVGEAGAVDLVVAAGWAVPEPLPPGEVLGASGGVAVLYEAGPEEDGCSWQLAHQCGGPTTVCLRRRQVAQAAYQVEQLPEVARVLAAGAGVIDFENSPLRLVLVICGENNALRTGSGGSVLRHVPDDLPDGALARTLRRPWAVLNPAHGPFGNYALKTSGFAKVGVVRNRAGECGPTLRRLTERADGFRDGTAPPAAVLHLNNFDHRPITVEHAAVAFGSASPEGRPLQGVLGGPGSEVACAWLATVYRLRPVEPVGG